jgi:two-component system cell cycle sensor histidine kinase/response regulator CckA
MINPNTAPLRVLVLDDDDSVRRVAARILRRKGFDVQEFGAAREAIDAIAAAPESFDVVITDAIMPGLSGPQVARQIEALAPSVPIVFMSGLSCEDLEAAFGLAPGCFVLQKPFEPAQLALVIHQAIEAREAAAA